MVLRSMTGVQRPVNRTDGTTRYPVPRALAAQMTNSPQEPTCYTQAARIPDL